MEKMKAVVLRGENQYRVEMVDIPEPGPNEVLVKIQAVAICGSDPRIFNGGSRINGWPPYYPFIAGHEFAGEVVKTGQGFIKFSKGERVAGEAHCGCGTCQMCKEGKYNLCLNYRKEGSGHHHYGHYTPGCYAQYQVYDVKSLTRLPDSVSFEEGALVDTAGTAYNALRLCGVVPGGWTVVIGPGPMGILAMELAQALGSKTIMIGRGRRLQVAGELDADVLINFEETKDVISEVRKYTGGRGADQVIEAAGGGEVFAGAVQMAGKGGHVAFITIPPEEIHGIPVKTLVMNQITLHGVRANPNCSDPVINLIVQKAINVKHLITHRFDIDDIHTAFDTFINRKDGAIKVIVEPWQKEKKNV